MIILSNILMLFAIVLFAETEPPIVLSEIETAPNVTLIPLNTDAAFCVTIPSIVFELTTVTPTSSTLKNMPLQFSSKEVRIPEIVLFDTSKFLEV